MIFFIRSTDALNDPRLQKYIGFAENRKIPYRVVAWNRSANAQVKENYLFFNKSSRYGAGFKNLFSLLLFNLFVFRVLVKSREMVKTIHACDFDTILPALLFKKLFGGKLIYDIFDWYVDSRALVNPVLKSIILRLEAVCLKNSDATIICEEERASQLVVLPQKLWVLPNIPDMQNFEPHLHPGSSSKIRLSYVGILSPERGLEKAIRFVSAHSDHFEFHMAGMGQLQDEIVALVKTASNIFYYGEVPYKSGLNLMKNSDLIVALYEKTNPNHIYAAPNKYYEGLFLGKPILTTEGTLVGKKTAKHKTGFVIGENYEDLEQFFQQDFFESELDESGARGQSLWNLKYSDYVRHFMDNTYSVFINESNRQ